MPDRDRKISGSSATVSGMTIYRWRCSEHPDSVWEFIGEIVMMDDAPVAADLVRVDHHSGDGGCRFVMTNPQVCLMSHGWGNTLPFVFDSAALDASELAVA